MSSYKWLLVSKQEEEEEEEEEEELRVQGPSVNEVSFRARPHHNVHRILGVDTGATGPL
jgi:hypothetical protein